MAYQKSDMENMQKEIQLSIDNAQLECGNGHIYQKKAIFITFLQYLAASFIASGWPLLFENPDIFCFTDYTHNDYYLCTEKEACSIKFPEDKQKTQHFFINRDDNFQNLTEEYDLFCHRKEWIYITTQIFILGGILGSLYYGWVMNSKGRLFVLTQSMGLMIVASLGSYFCFNIQIFAGMAFVIDFGFRGFNNASQILISEQSSENLRRMLPSILMCGWALGQIIICWIRSIYFEWKNVQLIMMGIPLILLFFNQTTLQDSPRYLVVKKQFKLAKNALLNIAKKNQRSVENFVLAEEVNAMKQVQREQQVLKSVYAQVALESYSRDNEENNHTYLSLFVYRSIRSKTYTFLYIWGITTLSYYVTMVEQRKYIEKSLSFHLVSAGVIEIVSYLIYMNLSLTYFRKYVIKHVLSALGVIHLLFIFVPMYSYEKEHNNNNFIAFFLLSVLRVITSGFVNSFMYVYTTEVFPTSVRHLAFGLFTAWTKFMWLLAPILAFFFDTHLPSIQPLSFIGIFLLIGVWPVRKLRETLDESGLIFKTTQDYLEEEDEYQGKY